MRHFPRLLATAAVIALAGCGSQVSTGEVAESPTLIGGAPSAPAPDPCPASLRSVPDPMPPEATAPRPLPFEAERLRVCRYDAAGGGDLVGEAEPGAAATQRLWQGARSGDPVTEPLVCTMEIGTGWLLLFTGADDTRLWLRADDYGCHLSQPVRVEGLDVDLAQVALTPAPRSLFTRLERLVGPSGATG